MSYKSETWSQDKMATLVGQYPQCWEEQAEGVGGGTLGKIGNSWKAAGVGRFPPCLAGRAMFLPSSSCLATFCLPMGIVHLQTAASLFGFSKSACGNKVKGQSFPLGKSRAFINPKRILTLCTFHPHACPHREVHTASPTN